MSARATAARLLQRVIYSGDSLTDVLQNYAAHNLPAQEQSLLRDLCFGTLRWHERLTGIIDELLSKPLKKSDKDVECLLRVGLYQLIYQRTPNHAAVNETVKAAKKLKKQWAGGLINGVLRSFLRNQNDILSRVEAAPSARYAFPEWLLTRLQTAWPQDWKNIVQACNDHPPMTLRVNQRAQTTAVYWQLLRTSAIPADPVDGVDSALNLQTPLNVEQLPAFAEGAVSVQDAAAQLAAGLLDCQPGMLVLDACAAPGGKTCHLLEITDDLQLLAIDNSSARLQRVHENLNRLHLHAEVLEADAGRPADWWNGQAFDRILLDAPCSATGVIRRHPDIKVLRQEEDIANLQQEQARLLRALWQALKPGGKLLYATCSILPEENIRQVEHFLQEQNDAVHLPITAKWGRALSIGRQILPGDSGMDGFYYALLAKQGGQQ